MATVGGGGSTSCGSFGQELPPRGKRAGDGTTFRPRNGGRSRGDTCQVKAPNPTLVAAGACVCRAAPCVLESDVAGKEETDMGVWGLDGEPHGSDGFDDGKRRELRRRPVRPPAVVEKGGGGRKKCSAGDGARVGQ